MKKTNGKRIDKIILKKKPLTEQSGVMIFMSFLEM